MKILIALFRYHYWGGLQSDTLRLCQEALARGHQVTVFTTSWPEPPEGIQLETTPRHGWSNVSRMRHFDRAWRERLARGGYDVSVAMDRVSGADFYFAADSCLKAYYHRKHPSWLLKLLPRYRFILGMEERVCGKDSPTRVWTIAPMQRKEFAAEYGTQPERLLELPTGMRPECVRPTEESEAERIRREVRRELELQEDDIAVIQIGSNLIRKGTDRLLRVLGAQPPELLRRLRFVLVGKNIPPDVLKLSHMGGFPTSQLRLTGPRTDVSRLLLGADMMVHPAREEGTGTVLVEALAAGIPVICSGCCGFSPIVAESGGIVVPEPYSPHAMGTAIQEMGTRLSDYTRKARDYGACHDFTSRQRVMVDCLESFVAQTDG